METNRTSSVLAGPQPQVVPVPDDGPSADRQTSRRSEAAVKTRRSEAALRSPAAARAQEREEAKRELTEIAQRYASPRASALGRLVRRLALWQLRRMT